MRNLTVANPELEQAERQTPHGMAHWAGSGPAGAKCGACAHYGYSYIRKNGHTAVRNSACFRFFQMTDGHGSSLREDQPGCKYFEADNKTRTPF